MWQALYEELADRNFMVLAVAMDDPEFNSFHDASELPEHRLAMLRRFFLDYKTLEEKTVVVEDFEGPEAANRTIRAAIEAYKKLRSC